MVQFGERIDLRAQLFRRGGGDGGMQGKGLSLARDEGLKGGVERVRQAGDSVEQRQGGGDAPLPVVTPGLGLANHVEQARQRFESVERGLVRFPQRQGGGAVANRGADRGERGAQRDHVRGEALGRKGSWRVQQARSVKHLPPEIRECVRQPG